MTSRNFNNYQEPPSPIVTHFSEKVFLPFRHKIIEALTLKAVASFMDDFSLKVYWKAEVVQNYDVTRNKW